MMATLVMMMTIMVGTEMIIVSVSVMMMTVM
jgi:hypothetical protein